jgi:uncharacterized DUF497 family protein
VNFDWDEKKQRENIRKHGFDFADAWEVFESPMLVDLDARDGFERRLTAIGFLRQRGLMGGAQSL